MKKNYLSVQALRGVGALLVVVFHAVIMLRDRLGVDVPMFSAGAAGVDLFFAISGFIMVVATRDGWGKAGQAVPFLKRRLIRILPLYWLMTTVKLAILVVGGHALLTSWHTVASYLLIPAWNDKQEVYPVLILGWTLFFEMFFYLLFAAMLWTQKNPLWPLTGLLLVLAVVGFVGAPFAAAPLRLLDLQLLEFVLGMWIAHWVLAGHRLAVPLAWGLVPLCLGIIFLTNALPMAMTDSYRLFFWGIPSAVLLVAVLAVDDHALWRSRLLRGVGDASYAIYLTHDFAISAVRVVIEKLHFSGNSAVVVGIMLSLAVASIGGYLVHRLLEKPMTDWLRKRV